MKLARLIPVAAVSLVVLISVMLLGFGVAQWRVYRAAQARPEGIRLIHEAMAIVEKISFERGPANGVLGDGEPADPAKRERLRQARAASDAAIATLATSLARDFPLRSDEAGQALYKTRVMLAQARRDVDSVAALPRRERTQERIMAGAVYPMFDVVPAAMETVTLLTHKVNTVCGRLPDAIAMAQLANIMREYAGRLGSQFTPALTEQKPVARNENEAIHLLRGRVEQLRMLIELPLELRSTDRRIVAAVEQMEQHYFGDSLSAAARVERLSEEKRLPYNLDTAQFAAQYVPGMGAIVHLRDVLVAIALEQAEKDARDARRHLIWTGLVGCVITAIVTLIFVAIYRLVIHPLFAIKQSLVSLADGNLNTRVPMSIRDDEVGDILDAVRVLQNNSIERQQLEMERQRLIDELEASEMHQIALNTELEQRVQRQTALLEQSHHELENILYSVANDFHTQLHMFEPLVQALARHADDGPVEEVDDLLALLRTCVRKLESCLAMLHELRWLRQLDPDISDVDMTIVVAQAADESSKRYPGAEIEIGALPPLRTDRIMMHKIVANLLDNALKYSSKSPAPKVEIGCRVLPDSKTYWIRDNGTGFDPQAAKRIFEPFQRLQPDGDYAGKGIGLTIVHRLVERLGGRIWAESRPGQGATFHFTLREPAQEPAARPAAAAPAPDFHI